MDEKIDVYKETEYILYELNGEKMVDFIWYENGKRIVFTSKFVEEGDE